MEKAQRDRPSDLPRTQEASAPIPRCANPTNDLALLGLAHDLNNVLQTVAHVADLLSTDRHWSAESNLLIRCVDRGRAILESLQEEPSVVDLLAVARKAAQGAAPMAVRLEIASDVQFPGKPLAFERALLNLLWNSARAGAQEACVAAQRGGDGRIEIEVSDNGPGIKESHLAKVFTPGFSTTASTGLGLRIVESIIQSHGGSIEVFNRGGACFRITIPSNSCNTGPVSSVLESVADGDDGPFAL